MSKMAKGPFMEFMRGSLAQSAANVFTEREVQTPTSKTETMAMLIHQIELRPARLIDSTPTAEDHIAVQIAKAPQDSTDDIDNPDIIAYYMARTHLDAVFNQMVEKGYQEVKFDPPILYPKSTIYAGINTIGFAAPMTLNFRIGYTLEKVSREDFIAALVD
ncbi:hypothetical protein ES705_43250 [subsurface metagenome]